MRSSLDDVTLLRYAHIYRDRTSGGSEQYLRQLNEGLLARNRMTILQMHLINNDVSSPSKVEIEMRGRGRIIWIPVRLYNTERSMRSLAHRLRLLALGRSVGTSTRKGFFYSIMHSMLNNWCGHLRYSTMILSEDLTDLLDEYSVDLVALHWLSYDVGTLVSNAVKRRIPYLVINHFDNRRLSAASTLRWVRKAAAVGGVSNQNVPRELEDIYVNLSDATDTDFFSPSRAKPVSRPEGFVVLLPGRLVAGKGHNDLLCAVKSLVQKDMNISVVFVGAVESELLLAGLEKKVSLLGMQDRVLFLGQLTAEGLRDWYAASDVVVLPSSSEGLGRVLLEAQAMKKPVIAYHCSGIPEAMLANKTGYLVKTGDYAALGERLNHLINNPNERFTMGRLGREFVVTRFSVSSLIERHEQFYSKVLSSQAANKAAIVKHIKQNI
jgi:glycosyltransferase involved in cell wall biosynthesis